MAALAGGVPAASGAAPAKKPAPRAYQYGNWAQVGAGFMTGADDTLSQVYQLTSRSQFPDLDDTPGPVYAAGTFIKAGSTTINRVGQLNNAGTAWLTLPGDDTGIGYGVGQSLAMNGGVSAGFAIPGVFGLVLGGDDSLYAGGSFDASDDSLNNVGQWQGNNWIRMGNGLKPGATTDYVVQDMVMGNDFIGGDDTNYADDTVYAVGGFAGTCATLACSSLGRTAAGIAQYSQRDDTWYPMGAGTMSSNSQAFAGAYLDDTLYIGGNFTTISGITLTGLAQWSEADDTWLSLGRGVGGGYVFSMAVNPITKDLYVGGTFTNPIGYPNGSTVGVAKWDYTDDTWYAVGTGMTSPNVDDISFSSDGKTMYIGGWAGSPTIGGTPANQIAILTSEDFDDTTATTISGAWSYTKSAGVIGVTGPNNSSISQKSVRSVLAQPGGTVMLGGNFNQAGAITAGRVALFTPGAEPSPYDPVYPPGAPTNVVATAGWNKVTVDWTAPTYTGSYPITNYLVTSLPGNKVCISTLQDAKLTQCTFTSLTPGTKYTFVVQALNGGGWGDRSAASNVASPYNLKITSYSRKKLNFFQGSGSEVRASGKAPGYAAGTRITPWTKIGDDAWVENTGSGLTVDQAGNFSWKRKFAKNKNSTPISVKFAISDNFSNTVVIGGVR